jgi:hypothetical protein
LPAHQRESVVRSTPSWLESTLFGVAPASFCTSRITVRGECARRPLNVSSGSSKNRHSSGLRSRPRSAARKNRLASG